VDEPKFAKSGAVSFQNDVVPVLSKAGCNAGTCHGNKNGKGGFKLSLRGQDPEIDYFNLTGDLFSRRVDPVAPDESLILLKPVTEVPHEGGLRFAMGSQEYQILRRWIAQRMPNDFGSAPKLQSITVTPPEKILPAPDYHVQLEVTAHFSDGQTRDVTSLAVYEPVNRLVTVSHDGFVDAKSDGETTVLVRYLQCQEPVRLAFVPERAGFKWTNPPNGNYIDNQIFSKLRVLKINPSELCSDEVFLRRACLDLLGILPTAAEARAFIGSPTGKESAQVRKRKRSELIDQLLQRPEFADFWALKWADLLRVEAHSLDEKGVQSFHHWIREGIATNKPIDQFVRELIAARGSTYLSPAANYYRPNRDAVSRAKAAAQVFLGTRLQCAECHNHPFDRWSQNDYYDWAGLFARVNFKIIQNNRDISTDEHEWKGEQVVFVSPSGSVKNPRTGKDALPRFLGVNTSLSNEEMDPLVELGNWLTSPTNSLFARVQANRIWFQLLGRGLVDPPDDFRATNPDSHPQLLDELASDFVKHKFDLRHMIRPIMNSRVYQLASEPNETNGRDESNFSHALVRRLSAEQLLDCQSEVIGAPLKFAGFPKGLRAAQLPGVRPESKDKRRASASDQFLEIFGKPPRLLNTDTERSCECNMGQAFQMINGPTVNELLAEPKNRASRLAESSQTNREIVEDLFWTALTRRPTKAESETFVAALDRAKDRRAELEDILWGILNSKEFVFRR